MPYGTRPLQAREVLILEDLRNKPHTLLAVKLSAVRRYAPGPLLPPVLKAMEPKICEVCCLIMTVYAEYSTHVYIEKPFLPPPLPSPVKGEGIYYPTVLPRDTLVSPFSMHRPYDLLTSQYQRLFCVCSRHFLPR